MHSRWIGEVYVKLGEFWGWHGVLFSFAPSPPALGIEPRAGVWTRQGYSA